MERELAASDARRGLAVGPCAEAAIAAEMEGRAWTDAPTPPVSWRTAAGYRYFPILWLTAMTGMRRNEVLGLKWPDIDFRKRPR